VCQSLGEPGNQRWGLCRRWSGFRRSLRRPPHFSLGWAFSEVVKSVSHRPPEPETNLITDLILPRSPQPRRLHFEYHGEISQVKQFNSIQRVINPVASRPSGDLCPELSIFVPGFAVDVKHLLALMMCVTRELNHGLALLQTLRPGRKSQADCLRDEYLTMEGIGMSNENIRSYIANLPIGTLRAAPQPRGPVEARRYRHRIQPDPVSGASQPARQGECRALPVGCSAGGSGRSSYPQSAAVD
jgi:hypothetical protein